VRFLHLFGLLLITTPAAAQEFEVASIKPAEIGRIPGQFHMGTKVDGDRVDMGYVSIADLIRMAYGVKLYQVTGPAWLRTGRFDVLAKIPAGTGKDDLPKMLRNLLAERFQLRFHREPVERNVYALVAGKDGAKLLPAIEEKQLGEPDRILSSNGSVSSFRIGAQRVTRISTPEGDTIRMSPADGAQHIESDSLSMAQLAQNLTEFLDRPVVDETGIEGNYRIAVDIGRSEMKSAMTLGRGGPPEGTSVFTSIRKLGLRLESRKEPIETLVVDSALQTPTGN
jgi:uncharacterized protein (TIGR03435 family)